MAGTAHFVMQGKGGAGKTFVSWLLTQYIKEHGNLVNGFDIDQQNPMLSSYKALPIKQIDLTAKEDSSAIDRSKFDNLMHAILDTEGDSVIDTGAKEFTALVGYMEANGIIEVVTDAGKEVALHVVVAGSDMLSSCMSGLELVMEHLSSSPASIYVWLNEHHGNLTFGTGKSFQDTQFWVKNKKRISGLITLERQPGEFAKQLAELREAALTFNEGKDSTEYGIIVKSRIHRMKQRMFSQLDLVFNSVPTSLSQNAK